MRRGAQVKTKDKREEKQVRRGGETVGERRRRERNLNKKTSSVEEEKYEGIGPRCGR